MTIQLLKKGRIEEVKEVVMDEIKGMILSYMNVGDILYLGSPNYDDKGYDLTLVYQSNSRLMYLVDDS